jgi:alpha-tubulin suppressor-like RCC1 family protein
MLSSNSQVFSMGSNSEG